MKELSAHGAKQITRRVQKPISEKGKYTVNEVTYSFKDLLALVTACNPKMTEALLRSRLKAGRRKLENLTGASK